MNDSQILSSFQASQAAALPVAPPVPTAPARALVFDACQLGVILRAVLFVEAVLAVGALFGASDLVDWASRLGLASAAGFPAVMAWLIVACSLKGWLARLPDRLQPLAGVLLGALAGAYGCAMPWWAGVLNPAPWLAGMSAGALVSAILVAGLVARARARAPAAAAAQLAQLQASIRPHFLFNTLNTAIALVREDPGRAETVLEDLSELFRHALADQREAVTLAEEVTLAQRYLEIEEVRFGGRLQVEWALDAAADTARVPPLCLQPLVENAVRHGVEPSEQGAQLMISTRRRGDTVVIKVTNTVPAGQGAPGQGVAQANVRERLQLLHDVQTRFEAGMRDGIYQVRIEVPA